jgi:hypothetical protein
MNRKLLFPILSLTLVILACNIQSSPIVSPSPTIASIGTPIPTTGITSTPVDTTNTPEFIPSITSLPTQEPTSSGLTLEKLKNATYFAPVFKRTIKLVNGSFSVNTASDVYNAQMLEAYAFGDLNGDGVEDAAIILVENSGGTGQFESVVAVYNSGGAPVQAGQSILGDRVQVKSMDISSGVIHLDMLVHGPTDPMCCPTMAEKQSFWEIAGHLWLMRVTSSTSGVDRSININSPASWGDVSSPFTVSGNVPISPFENTLAYHIYLADGTKVNDSSLLVSSEGMGTPGTFSHVINLTMAGIKGWVVIQYVDVSAADGSTLALGSVVVNVH